jgi:hypothetical protein
MGTCCSSLCTSSIVEVRANAGPIFVRNNGRLAVVFRVAAVFLILFILVIVGVPWRHRGADEVSQDRMLPEMPGIMLVSRWVDVVMMGAGR